MADPRLSQEQKKMAIRAAEVHVRALALEWLHLYTLGRQVPHPDIYQPGQPDVIEMKP